ncbi:hypothetical protein [Paenibacillus sp. NPDC055715]
MKKQVLIVGAGPTGLVLALGFKNKEFLFGLLKKMLDREQLLERS